MDALIKFFEGIGQAINTVIDFVISFFQDTVWIIKTVGWAFRQVGNLFSWIPPELLTVVTIIFTVVMIYKIMGRD